jgi:hypothetical protein
VQIAAERPFHADEEVLERPTPERWFAAPKPLLAQPALVHEIGPGRRVHVQSRQVDQGGGGEDLRHALDAAAGYR